MYKSVDADPGLTVVARLWQDGNVANNTSQAFVAPVAGQESNYNISAPEAGGANQSGRYVAQVPSWITQGLYSLTFYDNVTGARMGTVTVDTRDVSALSVTPSSGLSALILNLRTLANDLVDSNYIAEEGARPAPDASRTKFRLQNRNLVSGSVYASYSTTFRTQTGFTLDLPNGIVTFSSPPASGIDLKFDYNFQWFVDAAYTEFLTEGARIMSSTDPANVAAELVPALLQFGLYGFYNRRSTQYADKYNSTGGQAGQSVESVTSAFRKLAKDAYDRGMQLRDDYYENQGARKKAASAVTQYAFDPFTPRR